jgi:CRISPR-associated protein Csm5
MSMDRLHARHTLTIEVLTPVHIGTGTELLRDYDYAVRGGTTWIINQETLLAATLGESGEFDNTLLARPAAELLQPDDFHTDSSFFRYRLPGEPINRPLREQIKDVWGNPYLPGSSMKGMLRSLLMWGIYTAEQRLPDLSKLGNRRSWAAQPLEREMFSPGARGDRRRGPNMDVLRSLQVADSAPVDPAALHVATTNIYPTSKQEEGGGINVDVEALKPGTVFEATLHIEEYGFTQSRLGWDDLRKWLDRLPALGKHRTGNRIAAEVQFHKAQGPPYALNVYDQLVRTWESLGEDEWMGQLGWGTGWNSKTLDNLLSEQPTFERDVIERYRLARGNRRSGDPFPKSRNLVLHQGEPAIPMGWVRCRLKPIT